MKQRTSRSKKNIPAGFAYTDMGRSPFTEQMLLCYNAGRISGKSRKINWRQKEYGETGGPYFRQESGVIYIEKRGS